MKSRHLLMFAAVLLGLGVQAQSQTPLPATLPTGITQLSSVEGITEYRLANGLQVLLVPDDSKPTTTVNVTYRVGSRHENYGETGMAHLLEHLIFKGTPTTRNAWGEFTRRGLRANGSTSFDRTNYFASWSAKDDTLDWYLSWQADVMVNSFIARSDLDTEMTVVRNEMESGENNPSRVLLQQLMAVMYEWHNYGKSTIGARSDVENVDIARLQAFYRRHYQPDNATLIVSGKFDPMQTLVKVAKYFGPLPQPARSLAATYTLEAAQDGERSVTLRRVGGNALVYVGYHVTPGAHADFAAAQVLAQVLGDAPGGRLHKRLVSPSSGTPMAASSFGFAWALAEPGPLILGVQLAPGQDTGQARAEILATIDALAKEPVTTEELERARTQLLNAWEQGFNDPESVGVQLSGAIGQGDWRLFFLDRDDVRRITLADVNRVATERLTRDNRSVGNYLPTANPERAPAPKAVDVAALVKDYKGETLTANVAAFDPTPVNIDSATRLSTLPSGMKVALLSKPTRGAAVQGRLRLNFGNADTLRGQQTNASLMAALLDKGGAGLTRQQISDRFDALRAELSFTAEEQALTVAFSTRRQHLPALIDLLGRLLREPGFDVPALEEVRRQSLSSLEEQRQDPGALVANALDRLGNPYAVGDVRYVPTFDERRAAMSGATMAPIKAFHRRFYSAANAEFAAVGDVDVASTQQALQTAFGDWRTPLDNTPANLASGATAYVRVPKPFVATPPARLQLLTADKQNANMRLVLALPLAELHADYVALMMVNELFSEGGSSRLWQRMRERDGLSYGVQSVVQWNAVEDHSRWLVVASFAPQNLAKMEAALREETARALKDGFTQDEFERQRTGLLQERRLNRAQDAVLASGLLRNLHLGRTFAVSQQVDDALAKLTLAQVNAALRKYIDPSKWAIAWGGDFKP